MAQTLDSKGNVVVNGLSTNLNPTQYQNTFKTPSVTAEVPANVPFNSLVNTPKLTGSMGGYTIPPVNTSSVNQALSYSDIVQQEQAKRAQTQAELDNNTAINEFKKTLGLTGDVSLAEAKAAETSRLNESLGITDKTGLVTSLRNQIKGLEVTGEAQKQGIVGKGYGVENISTGNETIDRQNAIKRLNLTASLYAAEGDLETAKATRDEAITAKYAPQEAKFNNIKAFLEMNKDVLSREDAKANSEQLARVNAKIKDIEAQKETEKSISDIGMTLRKYGAPESAVKDVLESKNVNEAIRKAGNNLQDPKAKMELEGLRLDQINKKIQAQKATYELQLLKQYNGMSPSEYKKAIKEEQAEIANAKDASEAARLQGIALDKKITLLDSVLSSDAIDSVVGSSFASRAATGPSGFLGRFAAGAAIGGAAGLPFGGVGAVPGALIGGTALALQGSKDYFTGSADKLVGQTEQFISKEFIDSLIEAKKAGATFGALTKPEQEALTAAASFIGQRKIYAGKGEDKQVVGYDMSEKDFREEMTKIRQLAEKAYERSTGQTYNSDEKLLLDKAFEGQFNNTTSSPEAYY
jgi:hypothetical protein